MKNYTPDISAADGIWVAKLLGALAGSAISLAYVLPAGKREAAIRFLTGITAGLVFGLPVGLWLADQFKIADRLDDIEIALMGAAFSSLAIWAALGFALRFLETKFTPGNRPPDEKKDDA